MKNYVIAYRYIHNKSYSITLPWEELRITMILIHLHSLKVQGRKRGKREREREKKEVSPL